MTAGGDRPRRVLLVVAWVATAAVAIAISGWAVGLASRQVTDPIAPAALSEISRSVSPSVPDGGTTASPRPTASPSARPAAPAPATASTRTVSAVGGRASFRFEGGRVALEWATPSPGFEVDVEEHGGELRVRFRSDDHESRVFATVRDGQPSTRVEERTEAPDDARDDGDDGDDGDDDA